MSTKTQRVGRTETRTPWVRGVLGGLAAGVVMAGVFALLAPGLLPTAIPALVGASGVGAGLAVHLSLSAVFGVGFAALAEAVPEYAASPLAGALTGTTYGIGLWLVAASVAMPALLGAVGFANAPPVPTFDAGSFIAHVVFGAVLGAAYTLLGRTVE